MNNPGYFYCPPAPKRGDIGILYPRQFDAGNAATRVPSEGLFFAYGIKEATVVDLVAEVWHGGAKIADGFAVPTKVPGNWGFRFELPPPSGDPTLQLKVWGMKGLSKVEEAVDFRFE